MRGNGKLFPVSLVLLLLLFFLGGTFLPAQLFAQNPASALFLEAEARFRKGDYLFALRRYEELIKDYPVSEYVSDAWFRKGVILYRTGKSGESLSVLDRVEKRYGSTRFVEYIPFWKGLAHFSLNDYGKAEQELRRFLSNDPDQLQGDGEKYLALTLQELGLIEAAAETALSALKRELGEEEKGGQSGKSAQPDPWLLAFSVSLLLEAEREEEALSLMEGVDPASFTPQWSFKLAFYKAESLYRKGREEESVSWYETALDASLDTASLAYQRLYSIYRNLQMEEQRDALFDRAQLALAEKPELLNSFLLQAGIEQFRAGSGELAASYFRRVIRTSSIESSRDLALLYLARHIHAKGEREEALSRLSNEASGQSAISEEILFTLANFQTSLEQWREASKSLENLLGSFPETKRRSEAEYLRSYAEYRSGNYSRALALVENIFSSGYTGDNIPNLLRLKSRIHISLNQYDRGIEALKEYLPLAPEDLEAEKDLLRLYYQLKDYQRIIRNAPLLLERLSGDGEDVRYLLALSLVTERRYEDALAQFEMILSGEPDPTIISYALFYSGWSAYRLADFDLAVSRFSDLEKRFPDHELVERALYLHGWSLFSLGRYEEASRTFGKYGQQVAGRDADKGIFMYARSLAAAGNIEYATAAYQSLIGQKQSDYTDDALYAYAQLLQGEGRYDEAATAYYDLWQRYKTGIFAEDALYNRAELFYLQGAYGKAGDAFYFYRTRYPSGKLVDASLHYGARAALQQGEPYRAILLWEKLIEDHPKSTYHVDALEGLAREYQGVGEYRKSLAFYSRLLALYPDRGELIDAETAVSTLSKILDGANPAEARFEAVVEREGTSSREGVEATMELARIYLNRYDRKEGEARELLERVVEVSDRYGEAAARAYYLLGDLSFSQENLKKAVRFYLDAAAFGVDEDFSAKSLYRAAETAQEGGDRQTAAEIIRKIEASYPGSEWAARGRDLLEGRE